MLTACRLAVRKGTSPKLIIGANGGKSVVCSSQALPHYNNLVVLSQRGNYWATLVVRAITGLNAGRLHLDNIYIDKRKSVAYGKGAFYIVLPGVTASLEELPNGKYILQSLTVNHEYANMQKQAEKPGLWRISQRLDDEPKFLADGRITKKDERAVAIADRTTNELKTAVESIHESLMERDSTMANKVSHQGFDLHFTPGGRNILGLKKAKDALDTHGERAIAQSATLLANTMYMARNQHGVIWFSDFGGAAILTRALQILAKEKTITLQNHAIVMNHPTSTVKEAKAAAKYLGLTEFDKKGGILNPKELIGHFIQPEDLGAKTGAVVGATITGGSVAIGLVGAGGPVATIVGVAGGMLTLWETIGLARKTTRFQKY